MGIRNTLRHLRCVRKAATSPGACLASSQKSTTAWWIFIHWLRFWINSVDTFQTRIKSDNVNKHTLYMKTNRRFSTHLEWSLPDIRSAQCTSFVVQYRDGIRFNIHVEKNMKRNRQHEAGSDFWLWILRHAHKSIYTWTGNVVWQERKHVNRIGNTWTVLVTRELYW
jgi:hypothetical protein